MGSGQGRSQRGQTRRYLPRGGDAFGDPLSLLFDDPDHANDEQWGLLIGLSDERRVLVIAYTERGDVIRIISAREATRSRCASCATQRIARSRPR